MSEMKNEPDWMRDVPSGRSSVSCKPMEAWFAVNMPDLDFDNIYYYIKPTEKQVNSWEELPEAIKDTYDKLGIPEAERKYLAGVDRPVRVRGRLSTATEDLRRRASSSATWTPRSREHPSSCASGSARSSRRTTTSSPRSTRRCGRAARSSTCRPGEGRVPLQAYFRINAENMGQFERTLIIADEGAQVHYVEGCTAPMYSTRLAALGGRRARRDAGGRIRYTTIQNWSNNVYNLVTKRAVAEEEAHVEWIDGNIGSRLTMKYPAIWLMGPRALTARCSRSPSPVPASTRTPAPRWSTSRPRRRR